MWQCGRDQFVGLMDKIVLFSETGCCHPLLCAHALCLQVLLDKVILFHAHYRDKYHRKSGKLYQRAVLEILTICR